VSPEPSVPPGSQPGGAVIPEHAARHARPVTRPSPWRAVLTATLVAVLALTAWVVIAGASSDQVAAPAVLAAPAAAAEPAPQPTAAAITAEDRERCPAASVACVDLVDKMAWLQRDGQVVRGPVPMLPGTETGVRAPGPKSSATPTGSFTVQRKNAKAVSGEFGEPMPYAVYFAPGGIAFHEGSLTETSNGCVHLSPADAAAFFQALRIGDGVTVF
jgi:lipoprotein-anchoring transpeptidase ErfK/SrfK